MKRIDFASFVWILVAHSFAPAQPAPAQPAPAWRIVTADGSTIDADASLRIRADGAVERAKSTIVAAAVLEIVAVGANRPDVPNGPQAVLAGGDRIVGRVEAIDATSVRLQSTRIPTLTPTIPLSRVSILWMDRKPDGTQLQDPRWDFLTKPRRRDIVVLKTGERVDGTLRDMKDDRLSIAEDNDSKPRDRTFARADVLAIAFNTELTRTRKPADAYAVVALRDGSRLTVVAPTLEGGKLRATTLWKQPIEIEADAIASIRPENRGPIYLDDIKPAEYIYVAFLSESILWQAGRNSQLAPLSLREPAGVSTFERGIGMHSQSMLSFDLAKKYARFDCLVGLDAIDGKGGEAEILLRLDGKEIPGTRRILKSGDDARRLSVAVAGGSRLTLEVLHGKGGPVRDVVDWCNAVLIP